MNDLPEQSGPADSTGGTSFDLAGRLLRRAAEPAGVIDVRQPQRIHERTAGWVARRFALLDHWRTRYGGEEQTAGIGGEMIFAAAPVHPLKEVTGALPDVTTLARAAAPAESAKSGATISPSPMLRVSRRAARAPNAPDEIESPGGAEAVSPEALASQRAAGGIPMTPDAAQEGEVARHSRFEPATGNLSRARMEQSTSLGARASERATIEASVPAPAHEIQTEASSTNLRLQRQHKAESVGTARSREIIQGSPAGGQPFPTGSSRAPAIPVVFAAKTETVMIAPGAAARRAGVEVTEPAPGNAGLPLAPSMSRPSDAPQTIQRREESGQAGDWPLSGQVPYTGAAQSLQLPAVASEIPAASSGAPEPNLIWRKSAGEASTSQGVTAGRAAASPLPLKLDSAPAVAANVARLITTGAESGATSGIGASPPTATEPPAPAREVDVAQLAEQIGRLLSRQLAVERERRGIK